MNVRRLLSLAALLLAPAVSFAQGAATVDLALVDLRGKRQVLGTLPASVFAPRVSPDGQRVLFELADGDAAPGQRGPTSLWIADLTKIGDRHRLPKVGEGQNWAGIWSDDGSRVAFLVGGHEPGGLWWRRADGSGEPERLVDGRAPEGLYQSDRYLVFLTLTGERDYGISMLDTRTKQVTPLVDRQGTEQHSSRLSPDGQWIAYASSETGRQEVWVERLPVTGKRYQLTQTGGSHPLWSPDSKSVYFTRGGQLFRLPVFIGAESPKIGEPKALPVSGFVQGDLRRQFDLMPDGKRFLMLFPTPDLPSSRK